MPESPVEPSAALQETPQVTHIAGTPLPETLGSTMTASSADGTTSVADVSVFPHHSLPEIFERTDAPPVIIRGWVAEALHKQEISLHTAMEILAFVDRAENAEVTVIQRLQQFMLRMRVTCTALLEKIRKPRS